MKKILLTIISFLLITPNFLFAEAVTGKPAPDFSVIDSNGKTQKLSDYKGKYVVLEWFNPNCPFVEKHYETKNMQKLQTEITGYGAVWLTISSSAPEKSGFLSPAKANETIKELDMHSTALLLDHDGKVGKLYGAKTTPHMFLIDPQGNVVYSGAIDDKASTDTDDVPTAHNYVKAAFVEAGSNKPVTVASTSPYGCGVKY